MKRNNSSLVLGAAALLCWCVCALLAQRVGAYSRGVAVRWGEEQGLSPAQITQYERYAREDGAQSLPDTLLWRAQTGQSAALPDASRSAAVDVTQVYGSVELLYPLGFLSGWWPGRGDTQGCAIDEETASDLWGGVDVIGSTLEWDGKTYIVRGVFRGVKGLMVVQGSAEEAEPWPALSIAFPEGGGLEEAQRWLNQVGVAGGTVLDTPFLAWCLAALAALPTLFLGMGLLLRLFRRLLALRDAPLLLVQALPAAAALCAAAVWGMGFPWSLHVRLIPSRWSDFDFWGKLWDQFAATIKALLAQPLTAWDLSLWGAALACVVLAVVAAALVLFAAERARMTDGKTMVLGCLSILGAYLALVWLLLPLGGVRLNRGMWVLPLLWLIGDWGLRRHSVWLMPEERGGGSDETEEKAIEAKGPQR